MGTWEDLGRIISVPQFQNRSCNTQDCVPTCYEWSSWIECSKTCGGGYTERQRNCEFLRADADGNPKLSTYVEEEDGLCNNVSCLPDCMLFTMKAIYFLLFMLSLHTYFCFTGFKLI